jgi:hypothetical protein
VLNGFALNVQENPLYEGDSKSENLEEHGLNLKNYSFQS